ncbi:MAG: response regulator [Thermodesulfobacteriota bacterium]
MDTKIDFRTKILVVDHFSAMRKIIRNILKQIGFNEIAEADDGSSALTIIDQENIGLVLTDWHLPQISGLELLRRIRHNDATHHIPVLMVTADGKKENIVEAVKAGVDNFVVKPFTASTVKEKVEQVLAKRHP